MRLDALRLRDFRVFRGEHTIYLAPRTKYGKKRSIVLLGGLNGSGKTTILTAVRLVLYGKQSVGQSISENEYQRFLREAIHRSPTSPVGPDSASIALTFTHSKLGQLSEYIVTREWSVKKKRVDETLSLTRDGLEISELTHDQCQSFLNELIPPGVADLFFFDGERIAELAEDQGNVALAEATKRLLGLNLIERLSGDLATFVRRHRSLGLPDASKTALSEIEIKHKSLRDELVSHQNQRAELFNEIKYHEKLVSEAEQRLASKGGAWAIQRGQLQGRENALEEQRNEFELGLRELLGGLYPLSLAPQLLWKLDCQISKELQQQESRMVASALDSRLPQLVDALSEFAPHERIQSTVDRYFGDLLYTSTNETNESSLDLGFSESDFDLLRTWIREAREIVPYTADGLLKKLETVGSELAQISIQLERAPDEASVAPDYQELKEHQAMVATLNERRRVVSESIRQLAWKGLESVRAMRKIELEAVESERDDNAIKLAERSRDLLRDFSSQVRAHKLRELERQFRACYQRLAQKQDMILRVEIDAETFDVLLYGEDNKPVSKKRLSAGEKQIYAIAMLEALAKTSGRALPMIIDTPLGRLDSKHRNRLVNNYFPSASHQVVILSTDTEVDARFHADLAPHVSHAFHIVYSHEDRASNITEGYFWKKLRGEVANVS